MDQGYFDIIPHGKGFRIQTRTKMNLYPGKVWSGTKWKISRIPVFQGGQILLSDFHQGKIYSKVNDEELECSRAWHCVPLVYYNYMSMTSDTCLVELSRETEANGLN